MFVTVPLAADYADTLITDFGGIPQWDVTPIEVAPTVTLIALSAASVAAVSLRLFFAPGGGAAVENQIEIFNQAVNIGPIAVGRYVTIIGGQGGCLRAFRVGPTPMGLRATSTGLAGINSNIRVEWNPARAVT